MLFEQNHSAARQTLSGHTYHAVAEIGPADYIGRKRRRREQLNLILMATDLLRRVFAFSRDE
jgi:hypothetical protein